MRCTVYVHPQSQVTFLTKQYSIEQMLIASMATSLNTVAYMQRYVCMHVALNEQIIKRLIDYQNPALV